MTFSRKRLRKAARRGALLEAAQQYAALGISVAPMHSVRKGQSGRKGQCTCGDPNCTHPGKHPRVLGGWKKATTDKEQIDAWWDKWPDANIGLLMGPDADIVCLDIDKKHGGLKTLKWLKRELGPLPLTPKARSGGGGLHYFFRYPDIPICRDTRGLIFGPGVDLLPEKSLVLASPSEHISGQIYKWFKGRRLDSIERAPFPRHGWIRLTRGRLSSQSRTVRQHPQFPKANEMRC